MKICAGLGSVDDYPVLAKAGADELFLGYVPVEWLERYANFVPLNRREVLLHNIQADSMDDMRLLASMRQDMGVPVALTFNSLCYLPEQYAIIGDMLSELAAIGFDSCILADPALMLYLRANGYAGRIHLSGEAGCINTQAMRFWQGMGISRFIFPRKITPGEMARCIQSMPEAEYEAFVLNERCHFSGAFCSSLHCDEMDHLCQVEYRPYGPNAGPMAAHAYPADAPGAGGCGLCALPELYAAGVRYAKLVGRGSHTGWIVRDIGLLKRAIGIMEAEKDAALYRKELLAAVYPGGCSGQCYYL